MKTDSVIALAAGLLLTIACAVHSRSSPQSLASINRWESNREANLNRRMSLTKRKRIYYEYWKAVNRGLAEATHGDGAARGDEEIAAMRRRLHVSADDMDIIRTEGDRQGWPEPGLNEY